ncbi:ferredoxin [Amycolatopsis panacis]|uniref:Ferredoxin n=1 Tax=Amycolatopsis panacis TaxID=2340917 RepID=A0A419I7L7_9PSEU|nr:ferredoxin [Amycolatopsis panacis]RJQ87897.1 ferredoxin [Amycolatopsis panacis]
MPHVRVDPGKCQGHARCLVFAPEIFDLDDEGYSFVPEEHRHREQMTEDLRLAVANCPERAIVVKED